MSDTLVDSPPPPTIRDEPAPPPKPPSKRRGCLVGVALASLLTVAGVAAFIYFYFIHYEPVAQRHIPGNANLAARVSATDIAVFGPVRKHLWPLLFEQAFSSDGAPEQKGPSRAQRIRDATGVNLATDVREVIVASVDATSWVLIAGGRIAEGRFIDGIEKISRDEGWVGWRREGPLFVGPDPSAVDAQGRPTSKGSRMVIGQADDGTIIVGTDVDIVNAALPATDEWKRLGLPEDGAVTFALTDAAWGGVSGALGSGLAGGALGKPVALPGLPALSSGLSLGRITRATGRLTLGNSPTIVVRIEPVAGQDPAPLAADIERTLGALRILLLLAPDVAGEKEAIAATRVAAEGGVVTVTTPWPYEGLDRACERLARVLREALQKADTAPTAPPSPSHSGAPR